MHCLHCRKCTHINQQWVAAWYSTDATTSAIVMSLIVPEFSRLLTGFRRLFRLLKICLQRGEGGLEQEDENADDKKMYEVVLTKWEGRRKRDEEIRGVEESIEWCRMEERKGGRKEAWCGIWGSPHVTGCCPPHPSACPESILVAYHQGELGSILACVTPGFSHVRIVLDDITGRRVSSGISHFPRPFILVLLCTLLSHPHQLSRPRVPPWSTAHVATGAEAELGTWMTAGPAALEPGVDESQRYFTSLVDVSDHWLRSVGSLDGRLE
ncbi:hypothetical protein PR048_008762 [Dryococelus australis]|uniref:Uncharacterized protein n=1 Tax=Dryococelus australis TaxID=614101 RepID=A0ABQ9HY24_9NEOP|nr:hypothetical protein PR048_008762 [Dryococelus australis]